MKQNKLDLGQFIWWDHGENYPFSACMRKLMESLGGDTNLYTYGFFAGIAGDDFVFAYGDNRAFNDCVSVCEDVTTFCARVFGRIGLAYTLLTSDSDKETLLAKIQDFIDRGIPVLVKSQNDEEALGANYNLVSGYEGDTLTEEVGDPQWNHSYRLGEITATYIFIDTLPKIDNLAQVYREAILQLPSLMKGKAENGVTFGSAGLRRWADDIEGGRYDKYLTEEFESWGNWCIYICNIATNARHGWDFLARAYVHNPDMPNILTLIALLDRNERDAWHPLEGIGMGFGIQPAYFADEEKKAEAVRLIRALAVWHEEMEKLF